MSAPRVYTDLLIRISAPRGGGTEHAVEAAINADSLFFGGRLELDREKLRALILDNQAYGRVLREALFSDPIERAYQKARGIAAATTNGRLRIRLQIDPDASALHAQRWERLMLPAADQEVPLCVAGRTPFSRFIARESALTDPLTRRPVHMVVAISNPSNLPSGLTPIAVEKELRSLHRALQGVQTPGKIQLTILPGASGLSDGLRGQLEEAGIAIQDGATTLATLQNSLLNCDLFHFLGHGVFRPGQPRGTSALFLEQTDGSVQLAKDDDIVSRLGDGSRVPRLVFLAACESAKRSGDTLEAFVGLGPKLIQAGVPAVVGMQDLVPMQLAQALTGGFYQGLMQHGVIDRALNDARLALFDNGHADWSIPVLFMRIRDGRLFAPDPLRSLLEKIVESSERFFLDKEPPLPLDVVRLPGDREPDALFRQQTETTPGVDIKLVVDELLGDGSRGNDRGAELHITVLLGGAGTAKSAHLKHLAGYFAKRTLNTPDSAAIVPVFSHLGNLFKRDIGFQEGLHSFFLDALRQLSPVLDNGSFSNWLHDPQGPTFLFLIDGSDRLNTHDRTAALEHLGRFTKQHPRHRYLLVRDISRYSGLHLPISDYLIVKPMSQARLKGYLLDLPDQLGRSLYHRLEKAGLFDLATLPWVLVKILAQLRRGIEPRSRVGVLGRLVEEMIARIPGEKGLRARAVRSLCALGWRMQNSRRTVLSVSEAFRVMDQARGNRGYRLEELLTALTELRILAPVGDDAIRFAYPGLQAWFSAQALRTLPEQSAALDDITATFGRLPRLRWWADTLVLLSGGIADVDALVRLILYGGRITEGEQLFLAARCMQESGPGKTGKELYNQVINALLWLTRSDNEPSIARRRRACCTLGQLQATEAVPHLVKLVLEQGRSDWRGEPAFEYSSVRMAAVEALRSMASPTIEHVVEQHPQLTELMRSWLREDTEALELQLTAGPPTHQAIAAFVLGNIGSRPAADVLLGGFRQPGVDSGTRWAITDALLRMEPTLVTHGAILPFIDADAAAAVDLPDDSWKRRHNWYERVAYLIGHIKPADPRAGAFLDRCLHHYTGVWLKARAIRAIGALADTRYRELLQELTRGNFSHIAIGKPNAEEITYLRSVAIDALATVGDRETLSLLQQQDDGVDPQLHEAYYRSAEEITWRLFEHSQPVAAAPEEQE